MNKKRGVLTGLFVVMALASMVTAVFAHEVEILKSTPANGAVLDKSPETINIWFSEELISGESSVVVLNRQGNQVDNGDGGVDLNDPDHASMTATLPALPDGSYTVQWHAVLLDGDATDGSYAFAVGAGQTPVLTTTPTTATAEASGTSSTGKLAASGIVFVAFLLMVVLVLRRRYA